MPIVNLSDKIESINVNEKVGELILSIEDIKPLESRNDEISRNEVHVDSDVTEEQKDELLGLLNKYRCCIAKDHRSWGKLL